jgi:hypothetical protein
MAAQTKYERKKIHCGLSVKCDYVIMPLTGRDGNTNGCEIFQGKV